MESLLSSSSQQQQANLSDYLDNTNVNDNMDNNNKYCPYQLQMYPSDAFYQQYQSNTPRIFAGFLVGIFLFVYLVLALYNFIMTRKDKMAFAAQLRSAAIVDMFFPKEVKERLMQEQQEQQDRDVIAQIGNPAFDAHFSQELFAAGGGGDNGGTFDINRFLHDKPIASLYPETSVIFADIAGKHSSTTFIEIVCPTLRC
jgi:hypothetical protein